MSFWMRFQDKRRLGMFTEETEAVARALAPRPGERLLDLGGGTGVLTERIGQGFSQVVVVEPHPRRRAFGASVRPRIRFVGGGAERIDLPDGSFDCVSAVLSFHHFRDWDAAAKEVHRVLRPGGRLVVFEFSKSHGPGRFLKFLPMHRTRHAPEGHGVRGGRHGMLDPAELSRTLKRANFLPADTIDVGAGYIFTAVK
jgi:ubiquinone/menaquinone biosynthesis C-methylase UbiE